MPDTLLGALRGLSSPYSKPERLVILFPFTNARADRDMYKFSTYYFSGIQLRKTRGKIFLG